MDSACRRPLRASPRTAASTSWAPCSAWRARIRCRTAWTRWLGRIQNDLFDLGADLCVPEEERADRQSERERTRLRVSPEQVAWLEERCDEVNDGLPPLTSFVLAGGTPAAAVLHLARTVCRRAERETVALAAAEPVGRDGAAVPQPALRPALPARPRGESAGRGGALGAGRGARLMARRDRKALHETLSGIPVDPLYSPETTPLDYAAALGDPGTYPVHPRALRHDAPRPAVDDAHVRGLRHGGRDERALPLPARAGPDGPLDGLRHADADGLRLRRRRARSARSGARAWRSTRWPTWRTCSRASRWTRSPSR